tara:strand:+ start:49625 stop:51292 length:1668 start_codon:yes stop_codon:yes gene_type:complete
VTETIFEKNEGLQTATYNETIDYYRALSKSYPTVNIQEIGETDSGLPLHMVTFNTDKDFDFRKIHNNKAIVLINNGIHPGEPDGIDATMMLMRDFASGKLKAPKNIIIIAIPVYNIGGALNRNSSSRANQNGPEAYGFRGNARNYDLNRDFIKSDTKNALAFAEIFHLLNPDVFIDNHVSNGADYQYTLTHLFTQHNKLGNEAGHYLNKTLQPLLEKKLSEENHDITPYVNVFNRPPDDGFSQFMDSPRYSTGYTALFNTFGLMVETHMLKPYKDRVEGTYALMKHMIAITDENYQDIKTIRKDAYKAYSPRSEYPISWEIDSSKVTTLQFKGYESEYRTSKVSGKDRLFYDRDKPFTKPVKYYNHFKPSATVTIPTAYAIPQGWWNVIHLLKANAIEMRKLKNDTIIRAEIYRIEDFKTRSAPYEGHYQHYNTTFSKTTEDVTLKKGDYLVYTAQPGVKYLLETLEPHAVDSFFNWNFFDSILQQKEGFSPYVFEEIAYEILNNNPGLKREFENKKNEDEAFRENGYMQLDWIYKNSEYYEKAHKRYPVFRVLN